MSARLLFGVFAVVAAACTYWNAECAIGALSRGALSLGGVHWLLAGGCGVSTGFGLAGAVLGRRMLA
jgi:hypothetical protein